MKAKMLPYLIALVGLLPAMAAPAQKMNLNEVLDQMTASAAKFRDVKANITVDLYTAVVQEHEMQKGMTAFRRQGSGMEMVTHLDASNGKRVAELLFKGGELFYYEPAAQQETIFTGGSNRGEYNTMLSTGFGATGKELTSEWNVTYEGTETVDGKATAKLDLVSKLAKVRNMFSHLTIWVDLSRDITLKQVFLQPDGDSRTVTYSHIRYNTHLPDSLFVLHVAKGTQVTRK